LAIDKLYRLRYNHAIIEKRICKASYGIVINEPISRWRRKPHVPSPVQKNSIDNQQYAIERISWMIKKGEPVLRDEPICQNFFRLVTSAQVDLRGAEASIQWVDRIAMSRSERSRLPQGLYQGDANMVAEIVSTFPLSKLSDSSPSPHSPAVVKHKNRLPWTRKKAEYWEVGLELRMYTSSAGLRFKIWFGDLCIGETGPITVYWQYPRPESRNAGEHVVISNTPWEAALVPSGPRRYVGDSNAELLNASFHQ
jgi:hypothetical protein